MMNCMLINSVYASDEDYQNDHKTAEILNSIGIDVVSENTDYLSRAEFAYIIAQLIGYRGEASSDAVFEDVSPDSYYNGALVYLLNQKIISKASLFNPGSAIKFNEACKLTVSSLGLDYYAIANGGYPNGYYIAATRNDLLMGVESSEVLSYEGAMELIYNFMHAHTRVPIKINASDDYETVYDIGDNVLKLYHNIEFKENATVTATQLSGLYEQASACDKGYIDIDYVTYKFNGRDINLLGKCVDVYYKKGGGFDEILALDESGNNSVSISAEDVSGIYDAGVEYYEDRSKKRISLIKSPAFIFNNCAESDFELSDILSVSGKITFIDNNDDNKYEVVCISDARLFVVNEVNIYDNTILCEDKTIIDLSSEDGRYRIEKSATECLLSDIVSSDVIEVQIALGNKDIVYIRVIDAKRINGKITGIDKANRKLYINDVAYKYSKFFEENELMFYSLGSEITVILSSSNEIGTAIEGETKSKYGYYIAVKKDSGLSDAVYVKLLDDSGKADAYELCDNVFINGESMAKAQAFSKLENTGETIVRYTIETDKKIKSIVYDVKNGVLEDGNQENNYLTLYEFPTQHIYSTIWYIPETRMIHPYFKISPQTKVFAIVDDDRVEESQRYRYVGSSYFDSNKSIAPSKLFAYDVTETGEVGAIIVKTGSSVEKVSSDSSYGLVYSANKALSPDDSIAVSIVVYLKGTYKRLFLESEDVLKAIDPNASFDNIPVNPGDYIRYNLDARGYINALSKDYDSKEGKVSVDFINHLDRVTYYHGIVYDRDGNLISLVPESVSGVTSGLTEPSCRYRFNISSSITVYDSKYEKIYQGSISEIKTYLQSPSDCSKIIIKTYEGTIKDIILYK